MLYVAIVALVIGAIALAVGFNTEVGILGKGIGAVLVIVGLVAGVVSTTYSQDAGQAKVLVDKVGNVKGYDTSEGMSFKAPWVDTIDYNIRNQQAIFSNPNNTAEDTLGGEIDITDANGVAAKADLVVRYSIKPDSVEEIFREFGDQKSFESALILPEVRSVVRAIPSSYTTLEVLTQRPKIEAAILEALETKWAKEGVIVDSVSLQDIRYPEDVKQNYADAENSRTQVTKERALLEAAEVKAQQKIVDATAEAEANRKINESLTPEVLQLRGYDALKHAADKGNMIITDGSGTLLNVPAKK